MVALGQPYYLGVLALLAACWNAPPSTVSYLRDGVIFLVSYTGPRLFHTRLTRFPLSTRPHVLIAIILARGALCGGRGWKFLVTCARARV